MESDSQEKKKKKTGQEIDCYLKTYIEAALNTNKAKLNPVKGSVN